MLPLCCICVINTHRRTRSSGVNPNESHIRLPGRALRHIDTLNRDRAGGCVQLIPGQPERLRPIDSRICNLEDGDRRRESSEVQDRGPCHDNGLGSGRSRPKGSRRSCRSCRSSCPLRSFWSLRSLRSCGARRSRRTGVSGWPPLSRRSCGSCAARGSRHSRGTGRPCKAHGPGPSCRPRGSRCTSVSDGSNRTGWPSGSRGTGVPGKSRGSGGAR